MRFKVKGTETIEDICPVYSDLTTDEQLSIWFDYMLLIHEDDEEFTLWFFNIMLFQVKAILSMAGIWDNEKIYKD